MTTNNGQSTPQAQKVTRRDVLKALALLPAAALPTLPTKQPEQDLAALFIEQAPQYDPETLQKETSRVTCDLLILGTEAIQFRKGELSLEQFTKRVNSIQPDAIALLLARLAEAEAPATTEGVSDEHS